MADDEQAIAPSEPAEPTIATEQVEEPTPESEAPSPEEELEEFEWEGKPIRGPKGLKDGILRQADYTRKTQELAEKGRALESREAEINQRREADEAELDARAGLRTVTSELKRLETYDFAAYQQHRQQDPMGAQEIWDYLQHLRSQKAEFEGTISKTQQERTAKAQQETAKRWQETGAYAAKSIPGWSNDLANKVLDFAEKEGVPRTFLQDNMSPVLIRLMHRAYIGEQTLSRPAQKPASPPPEPLKIVAAKGNPSPTALSDNLSPEEWARRRNAQLRKRG